MEASDDTSTMLLRAIALVLLFSCMPSGQAQTLEVLTEEWSPYNFTVDGKVTGIATDLVEQVLALAGLPYRLTSMPWARAYQAALTEPNVLIYTMARTADRESKFQWIGPFFSRSIQLYRLKTRTDIAIKQFDDVKRWKVPVTRDDATMVELIRRGFPASNLELVYGDNSAMIMLVTGRVDLIPGSALALRSQLKAPDLVNRLAFQDLVPVYTLVDQGGYYMALSATTSATVVSSLRAAFQKLDKQGVPDRLMNAYMQSSD